jgi:hypothetical protein
MKKILMLIPLLAFLAGCSPKTEDQSSAPAAPASTNAAGTNAPAK